MAFGTDESVLFREVSLIQGVLIERFHCVCVCVCVYVCMYVSIHIFTIYTCMYVHELSLTLSLSPCVCVCVCLESLAVLLSSSHHGPVDIYKKLLQLVVAPDDKFRSKFKGRGLKWETLAGEYLGLTMTSSSDDVANYRLCLVELLVSEALTTVSGLRLYRR